MGAAGSVEKTLQNVPNLLTKEQCGELASSHGVTVNERMFAILSNKEGLIPKPAVVRYCQLNAIAANPEAATAAAAPAKPAAPPGAKKDGREVMRRVSMAKGARPAPGAAARAQGVLRLRLHAQAQAPAHGRRAAAPEPRRQQPGLPGEIPRGRSRRDDARARSRRGGRCSDGSRSLVEGDADATTLERGRRGRCSDGSLSLVERSAELRRRRVARAKAASTLGRPQATGAANKFDANFVDADEERARRQKHAEALRMQAEEAMARFNELPLNEQKLAKNDGSLEMRAAARKRARRPSARPPELGRAGARPDASRAPVDASPRHARATTLPWMRVPTGTRRRTSRSA